MDRIKAQIHNLLMVQHYDSGVYLGVEELDQGYDEILFKFRGYNITYTRFDRDDQEVIFTQNNKVEIMPVLGAVEARKVILSLVEDLERAVA